MFRIFIVGFMVFGSFVTEADARRKGLFRRRANTTVTAPASNQCQPGSACDINGQGAITGMAPASAMGQVYQQPQVWATPTPVVSENVIRVESKQTKVTKKAKSAVTLKSLLDLEQQQEADLARTKVLVERKKEIELLALKQEIANKEREIQRQQILLDEKIEEIEMKSAMEKLQAEHEIEDLVSFRLAVLSISEPLILDDVK